MCIYILLFGCRLNILVCMHVFSSIKYIYFFCMHIFISVEYIRFCVEYTFACMNTYLLLICCLCVYIHLFCLYSRRNVSHSDLCFQYNRYFFMTASFLTWPRSTGAWLAMDFRLATAFSKRCP